jgi:hypothetical protein
MKLIFYLQKRVFFFCGKGYFQRSFSLFSTTRLFEGLCELRITNCHRSSAATTFKHSLDLKFSTLAATDHDMVKRKHTKVSLPLHAITDRQDDLRAQQSDETKVFFSRGCEGEGEEDGNREFLEGNGGRKKQEEEKEALQRPPEVNSDYVPIPWKGRLGYVRNNPLFFSKKERIY